MLAVRRTSLVAPLALFSLLLLACDHQPLEPRFEAASVGAPGLRAPSGTDARPSNSTTIDISWTDNSPNEAGFRIERSATNAGPWATAGTVAPNVTSFGDGARASEQQVCYRVLAFKKNGDASPSNADCSTPPAAASNLTATALDQQTVDVAWKDNSSVEDGYEVQRATAQAGPYVAVASLPANGVSYRSNGLTTSTTYWYRVRAIKDGGFGDFSDVAIATPFLAPPNAASETNAAPFYGVAIDVTWIDNATNEDGFRIERTEDGGALWITLGPVGRDVTSTQDYGFQTAEQSVCYRVIAFNVQGDAPPSNTDCTAQPAAASNLTGAGLSGPAIELTWADNSTLEDGFVVERSGSGIIATLPANATSYRDAAVIPDVTYTYVVRATKDGGSSANSNSVQAVVATVPPVAPSVANAYPASSTVASVTWVDNATNEAGFRVERSTDGGASWVIAGTTGTDATWFSDEGLIPEQQVCYRVFAFNSHGVSGSSNVDCTVPPAGPTNLVVNYQTYDLVWSDNSGVEDGYEVWVEWVYEDGSLGFMGIASLPPNTTRFSDRDANNRGFCCGWRYLVYAVKDGGYSDPIW